MTGETVSFQYLRKKKDFDEGRLVQVIQASPHRVEPRCPHYSVCGGCSMQHLDGEAQIHEKQALLMDLLARIGRTEPERVLEPLTAALWNYRNKARLSVRYVEKKQATLVGFREKNNPRYIADIEQCPVLNVRMDAELKHLRNVLDTMDAPHTIAQIEVAAGDEELALIFRNLEPLSVGDEEKIRDFARATASRIFLQPAGPDSVYLFYPDDGRQYLSYALPEQGIRLQFHPTDFTQVNADLNKKMIEQALSLLELKPDDKVMDLFCGLGNFSLPLAKYAAHVIGIEGSAAMVERAQMNAASNGLFNTTFYAANLEDELVLGAYAQQGINKMLLDPPRTGALEIVKHIHHLALERIVYVSCNPATLARDADILVHQQGFRMVAAGVMDMFPHTAHVESIALFEK